MKVDHQLDKLPSSWLEELRANRAGNDSQSFNSLTLKLLILLRIIAGISVISEEDLKSIIEVGLIELFRDFYGR